MIHQPKERMQVLLIMVMKDHSTEMLLDSIKWTSHKDLQTLKLHNQMMNMIVMSFIQMNSKIQKMRPRAKTKITRTETMMTVPLMKLLSKRKVVYKM